MKLFLKNNIVVAVLALLLVGAISAPLFAAERVLAKKDYSPYPAPGAGYVTDLANLLTVDEEERIEKWLWQVESRSGIEIIVFTLNSIKDYPGAENDSIESFATALFDTYGIGNMPDNNGILLLIARNDRRARIELGAAYGRFRDRDAQQIMDDVIIPKFKKNDYAAGITSGTKAIIKEFAGMRVGFPWYIVWVLVGAIVSLLIGISLMTSGKKGWGYVFIGMAIVLLLLALYLIVQVLKHMPKSSSSSWSPGGLGGFGGGSSGGGGATGGW